MNSTRRRLLAAAAALPAVASLPSLTGCASATPVGSSFGRTVPVQPAGFRLGAVQVRWQDNPSFGYDVSYVRTQYQPNKALNDAERERAKVYMGKVMALYRAHAVTMSTDQLLKAGVQFGATHTVVLFPVKGHFGESGGASGITLRANILGTDRRLLYSIDIDSKSGWHLNGLSTSEPDESYVRNFAETLVATFKQAGLLA